VCVCVCVYACLRACLRACVSVLCMCVWSAKQRSKTQTPMENFAELFYRNEAGKVAAAALALC